MPILGVIASSISGNLWPAGAFESIATATGTGSNATITFSSIPSTYVALQIRFNARSDSGIASDYVLARLNSDSSANYTYHGFEGNGTAASAFGSTGEGAAFGVEITTSVSASNIMGVGIIDILDYASTTKYKTITQYGGNDKNNSGLMGYRSQLWLSTSAINRIDIISYRAANWTTSSTFALYGIKG